MITRSGIEVAMDAETSHPDALVADALEEGSIIGGGGRCDCGTGDETTRRAHAVRLQVRNVKAHVEVLRHVPLGAGANEPLGPVVVAAELRKCQTATAGARTLQRAKDGIGLLVIAH